MVNVLRKAKRNGGGRLSRPGKLSTYPNCSLTSGSSANRGGRRAPYRLVIYSGRGVAGRPHTRVARSTLRRIFGREDVARLKVTRSESLTLIEYSRGSVARHWIYFTDTHNVAEGAGAASLAAALADPEGRRYGRRSHRDRR